MTTVPQTILALSLSDAGMVVGLRRERDASAQIDVLIDPRCDQHSEHLMAAIDQLLIGCAVSIDAVNAVAFDAGPGGFTRVRVACAVAQGLALGREIPVAAIDSLEARALAAYRQSGDASVAVCIDARMRQSYVGHYHFSEVYGETHIEPRQSAHALDDSALRQWLDLLNDHSDRSLTKTGSGLALVGDIFEQTERIELSDRFTEPLQIDGRAIMHALLALAVSNGHWQNPDAVAPRYVREKVALNVSEQAALRANARPKSSD